MQNIIYINNFKNMINKYHYYYYYYFKYHQLSYCKGKAGGL